MHGTRSGIVSPKSSPTEDTFYILDCDESVSNFFKSSNIWQSYKQERGCLMHFAHLANTLLKDEESAQEQSRSCL